jgi:hypothetical protein
MGESAMSQHTGLQLDLGGIYSFLARVLAPDLGKQVANRDGKCIVLIEHQLDAEHFRVRIARCWQDLQTDDRAFVSILSKFQFTLGHAERVGCSDVSNMVQVAPAAILPPEERLLYSSAGLCYYITEGRLDSSGQQEVTVAALPERLRPYGQGRIGVLVLSAEQRKYALDYTPQLASLPTCELRDLVTAHCNLVAPDMVIVQERPVQPAARQAMLPQGVQQATANVIPVQPLEKVFVPIKLIYAVAQRMQEHAVVERYRREKLWLRAVIWTISLQLSLAAANNLLQELDWYVRCVLVVHLYRRDLPKLVDVEPVYQRGNVIGYDIQVSVPSEQLAA